MPSLLEARKGGKGGGSYGSGGHSGGSGGSGEGWNHLETWVKILVIVGSILFFIWLVAFLHYLQKAFKRKKLGQPFGFGKVLWQSFRAVSGLWLPIWVIKQCRGGKKAKGVYAKIDTPNQSQTASWAGPQATYVAVSANGKYEPMGYAPYSAQTYAPPASTAPPPYVTPTPPVQQQAAYYMPAPPAHTAYRTVSPAPINPQSTYQPSPPPHNTLTSATYVPSQGSYLP